jgi:uncharacterized peroxidase-related enzyme
MTWIDSISREKATGYLKRLYQIYQRPNRTIANIYRAHSLRPHTLEGHVALYRAVLGHTGNQLPLWFLEAIGLYVSALNQCAYCIDHHTHKGGLAYPGEPEAWSAMADAMLKDHAQNVFENKELALLAYVRNLTLNPASLTATSINSLRQAGASDGEILEVNQVTSYFAYANRVILGLGVTLDGEVRAE